MKTITTSAYAKINLYLKVAGRRPDGYHDLVSVMQTVSLHDDVTLTVSDGRSIVLTCSDPSIPTDGRNIAYRCAEHFFSAFPDVRCSVAIDLVKRIPAEAGLGGGSADGAAVLRLLNDLTGVHASLDTLCSIGAGIGADIPFCVVGGTCLCEGTGSVVSPLKIPEPSYQVLLVMPSRSAVSTGEAYRLLDGQGSLSSGPGPVDLTIDELAGGGLPVHLFNSFEEVILPRNPGIREARSMMENTGADAVLMSGSGSAVFGLYAGEPGCRSAFEQIRNNGIRAWMCRPVPTFNQ